MSLQELAPLLGDAEDECVLWSVGSVLLEFQDGRSLWRWVQAFSRGILCNWLVCAAVWMANACSSATGKAVAVWFPISAFVALGLEHSVANMFMVPLGIALGANVSFSHFLTSNLLPVTLGNTVAGVACLGLTYSLMYGKAGKDL